MTWDDVLDPRLCRKLRAHLGFFRVWHAVVVLQKWGSREGAATRSDEQQSKDEFHGDE